MCLSQLAPAYREIPNLEAADPTLARTLPLACQSRKQNGPKSAFTLLEIAAGTGATLDGYRFDSNGATDAPQHPLDLLPPTS